MKKIKPLVILIAAAFAAPAGIAAQNYPATDENDQKIYYKIVSADPQYGKKCLEDNSATSGTSKYKFLINNLADDNRYQEWELIADADSDNKYYLRNRQSRKYVSTKGTWVDNYLSAENTTTKMSTDPYEFIELTHDQVAIKYNDGASDNYLFVADSAQNVPTFDKYNLADSRWAWFVSDPNGTPVSIKDITADKNAEISVENRQIKVNGTDRFEVFDIEGRQLDSKGTRQPGIYIVVVNNVAYKVAGE